MSFTTLVVYIFGFSAALGLAHAALVGPSPLSFVFAPLGAIGLTVCGFSFGWWLASIRDGYGS